ncbi:hypothetical protein EK21DRAFT_34283, partial [Setomelanomma holmii]
PSSFRTQDARSNLAVQPAANAGNVKLKKAAVKIVSSTTTSGALSTPSRVPVAAGASPTAGASPVPGPVKAKPKEPEGPARPVPVAEVELDAAPQPAPPKIEVPAPVSAGESALDEMFARLNAMGSAMSSTKADTQAPPVKGQYSFDEGPTVKNTPVGVLKSYTANPSVTSDDSRIAVAGNITTTSASETETDLRQEAAKTEKVQDTVQSKDVSQQDLERAYMRKAAEYIEAIPGGEGTIHNIRTTSAKLRTSQAPGAQLSTADAEKLAARFAFATVNYINKIKKSEKIITSEATKKALKDAGGNLICLYVQLVQDGYLSLNDLEGIGGLCNTMLAVLPKPEPASARTTVSATASASAPAPVSTSAPAAVKTETKANDPVENMKAWPTQEKREAPPAYRACILKGVSGVKSINQLQALVWGGRLESIAMPTPGFDCAVVRFLTPEACDNYFKATENGIEIQGQGDKKTVVFVEKQPAPSSINDVMRNCTDGDASRCVRAIDAEEDWSDMLLMKLAKGKGASKREVDRIKRGKTARGRFYIEFRFANIYHALNFKRQLMEDPDWEHCTIAYATDPCETARSVHYKDEDE